MKLIVKKYWDKSLSFDTNSTSIRPEKTTMTAKSIIVDYFSNDKKRYEEWLSENGSGFVFNHYGGTDASKDTNKLHQCDCRYLHCKQDEGKRTTAYPKICSSDLRDLEAQVVQLRGSSWVYCKNCLN